MALPGVTFSADYDLESSTVVTHNVIGKLVGTSRPNEAVLYGAHWDHLGIGAPDASGDKIYHGAVDNASGVSALIELGRLFAEAPHTQRSLYFIAFTSEEKNLLGAGYYAAHPVVPLGTTVALLNMDVMNLDGASRDVSDRGPGNMPLETLFAAEGAKLGRTYSPDPQPHSGRTGLRRRRLLPRRPLRPGGGRTSQSSPPATRARRCRRSPCRGRTGLRRLRGGRACAGKAAHAAYFTAHYHQPSDRWRPDFNYAGVVRDLEVYYALGHDLAESHDWPGWEPTSQFKPARDASAAMRK